MLHQDFQIKTQVNHGSSAKPESGRSRQRRPPASVPLGLLLTFILSFSSLPAAESAEYLAAEEPIPESLEQAPSATDQIGTVQNSHTTWEKLHLRWILPELRARVPTTGQAFFDDAKFHFNPRSYYFHRKFSDGHQSEAFAIGGAFGLESGYLSDLLRIGITGYTSQKIHGPADRPGSGLLRPEQQSYTALGEAYVDIKLHETSHLTLFRQRIDIPFINSFDISMTPNTFETYLFRSAVTPELHLGFGHFRKIKTRMSSNFEYMSATAGATGTRKGVTVGEARYDFSDNFHASIVEEYGWDTFNTLYLETELLISLCNQLKLKTGLQFTDQRSVGDELIGSFDSQHFGCKLSLGYQALIASASFTWTSKEGGIKKPWGGSPSYNSIMIADFDRAGEKSIGLGVSYDFTELGLTGFAASTNYVHGNTPDAGSAASPDQQEFDINLDYRPSIKGLDSFWLRLRYASDKQKATQGGVTRDDFRVILNYALSF